MAFDRRAGAVENDLLICRRGVGRGDRRLRRAAHRHHQLVIGDRRTHAEIVALDLQGCAIGAGIEIGVLRLIAAAGLAVAEIPAEAVDDAVDIGRLAAVELHWRVGADIEVHAGARHRGRQDRHQRVVRAVAVLQARLVGHLELDPVAAGRGVGLGRVDDVGGGAVAELPFVAQHAVVGIGRRTAVKHHDIADAGSLVVAGDGLRRTVDAHRHGVAALRIGKPAAIIDGQQYGIDAAGRIGMLDHRALADQCRRRNPRDRRARHCRRRPTRCRRARSAAHR